MFLTGQDLSALKFEIETISWGMRKTFAIFASLVLFISLSARADDNGISVTWFKPFAAQAKPKSEISVMIFGKTEANTRVVVDPSTIIMIESEGGPNLQTRKLAFVATADKSGYFHITLRLMPGLLQIPVEVQPPANKPTTLVLTLQLTPAKAEIMTPTAADDERVGAWRSRLQLAFGGARSVQLGMTGMHIRLNAGVAYQGINESTNIDRGVKFGKFDSPDLGLKLSIYKPTWSLHAQNEIVNGSAGGAAQGLTVDNSNFVHSVYSIEGGVPVGANAFANRNRWDVMVGLQYSSDPFFSLGSSTDLAMREVNTAFVSLGASLTSTLTKNQFLAVFLRYQYPFLSKASGSTSFSLHPALDLGGSVDYIYRFSRRYFAGASWIGNWHQYSFSYSDSGGAFSGKQTVVNSTLDGFVGYSF
jgi:hypothetical protein